MSGWNTLLHVFRNRKQNSSWRGNTKAATVIPVASVSPFTGTWPETGVLPDTVQTRSSNTAPQRRSRIQLRQNKFPLPWNVRSSPYPDGAWSSPCLSAAGGPVPDSGCGQVQVEEEGTAGHPLSAGEIAVRGALPHGDPDVPLRHAVHQLCSQDPPEPLQFLRACRERADCKERTNEQTITEQILQVFYGVLLVSDGKYFTRPTGLCIVENLCRPNVGWPSGMVLTRCQHFLFHQPSILLILHREPVLHQEKEHVVCLPVPNNHMLQVPRWIQSWNTRTITSHLLLNRYFFLVCLFLFSIIKYL